MKLFLFAVLIILAAPFSFAQEEIISPLLTNPNISKKQNLYQQRVGNSIDSTFIYNFDTLDLPVWDDFAINRFEQYDAGYADGNVTSQEYFHLMNSSNTVPQNPALTFCDSTHARIDTVSVITGIGTTTSDYFTTPNSVWVNDLGSYPVTGMSRILYQECYVIIDSLVDGVWDDDRDTIYFAPDFVQDSATVFSVAVSDPNVVWVDNSAYHNYTYAVNPWTLGVATLDGVGEDGWPYDWGNTTAHEPADVLTSRPVNLAGKAPGSVWLTFLYQPEGYGNAPEANDSLILDIWLPDSAKWYKVWYTVGGMVPIDTWETLHYAVPIAAYDDGFRFRFRNWASTSGNLDHWHLENVRLISPEDATLDPFNDIAISEPIKTMLMKYTAVPWDHYRNNPTGKMIDTIRVKSISSNTANQNVGVGQLEVSFGGVVQGTYPLGNPSGIPWWASDWQPLPAINYFPCLVGNLGYSFNPLVTTEPQAEFDVKLSIDADVGPGSNVSLQNDTTYFKQKFKNYYAYDDGSAEGAYGITGSHGLLAYKFIAYESDTLTGVLMHFVPSVDNVVDNTFLITIWEDNSGQPGEIIYQDDYFHTNHPEYTNSLNGFRYYTFQDLQSVIVPDTFYVGWEQIDAVSLNIGIDMNIVNSSNMFRNVTGSWVTSSQPGSLLMRPVFSTGLNYTLSNPEITTEVATVQIFPNPASNLVNITGVENEFKLNIFDMTGRLVYTAANETQFDISDFNSGLYLVDIRDENGLSLYSGKLIKE